MPNNDREQSARSGSSRQQSGGPLGSQNIMGEDYLPPHSIEAEQSVLGAMCIEEAAADTGIDLLDYTDFYRETHQSLFACFRDLRIAGKPVDLVTVPALLKDREQLDYIGGMTYLLSLFDTVPTASNIAYYADIVREKAALRRLAAAGLEIVRLAKQEDRRADELTQKAESTVYALKLRGREETGSKLTDVLDRLEQRWSEMDDAPDTLSGLRTGLAAFDRQTNGLRANQLVIIAGRTGMGKTATLCTMAVGAAISNGRPCYIHSAEMSRDEILERIICCVAEIDNCRLQARRLTQEEWDRYHETSEQLRAARIFIDERKNPTPGQIRSTARRVVSLYGDIGSIWVDYIGLMKPDRPTDNPVNDLGTVAYDLKTMAGELKIPVIALAQLNRGVESRDNKRPTLSDIRESGKIEEAADIVVGLYREEYYRQRQPGAVKGDDTQADEVELIFLKHRNGPMGTEKVGFIPAYTQMLDLEDSDGASEMGLVGPKP